MSCKHPMKGFLIRPRSPTEPAEIKVCSYNVDRIYKMDRDAPWLPASGPIMPYEYRTITDFIELPCGKCIECRLAYSRQWADRCMLELQSHQSSYFVTLTYDDDHLPVNDWLHEDTGEFGQSPTLCKRDVQLFMKRLRQRTGQKLRYFLAGEYGETTHRPHYHAVIFGLELNDLVFYKRSPQGWNYYISPMLADIWSLGYVVVTNVTWDTCAYTARYIMKKQKGTDASKVYTDYNFVPEFTLMSRKPGIARDYYDNHRDELYKSDYISVSTPTGGRNIRPSRYYDKLYDIDNPEDMYAIKQLRLELSKQATKLKMSQTDNSYLDMLASEESAKMAKIQSLKRSLC